MEPIFSEKNLPDEKNVEDKKAVYNSTATTPQKPNKPKHVVRRTAKNISTPSIKAALRGEFKDDKQELSAKQQFELHTKDDEFEKFTKDDLELKWKEFLTRLNDRPNLQSTLAQVPELKENSQLFLEIDNSIQNNLIASIKPELVSFLRRELRNSKIELIVEVTENIKNRIIYTDNDKFDEMAKKNPSLKILKQKFNLDFGE